MISTRSRYGLRFLVELSRNAGGSPVDVGTIAKKEALPETYLLKLVARLKAAGAISSSRGAKGGFTLAKPPRLISVAEAVEALEGRSSLLDCVARPESCPRSAFCPTRDLWRGLDRVIKDYLSALSIADLAETKEPDYSI